MFENTSRETAIALLKEVIDQRDAMRAAIKQFIAAEHGLAQDVPGSGSAWQRAYTALCDIADKEDTV